MFWAWRQPSVKADEREIYYSLPHFIQIKEEASSVFWHKFMATNVGCSLDTDENCGSTAASAAAAEKDSASSDVPTTSSLLLRPLSDLITI